MKSYNGLALKYIKKQKRRTLLLTITITISIAFITTIGILNESSKKAWVENIKRTSGDYHASLITDYSEKVDGLKGNKKIEKVGFIYNPGINLVQPTNNLKVSLIALDKDAIEINNVSLIAGRLPEKKGEIALKEGFINKLPSIPSIGSTLTFFNNTHNHEHKDIQEANIEYVLVGVYMTPSITISDTDTGIVSTDTFISYGGVLQGQCLVKVKDSFSVKKTITEITTSLNIDDHDVILNEELLKATGQETDISKSLVNYILVALIIIATSTFIYNIFQISVVERIQQFGILRAIGATPPQLLSIILREALLIALFSIPSGLFLGSIFSYLAVNIFPLMFNDFNGTATVISFSTSTFIWPALLGFICICLSAYYPASFAAIISPMEA